ncbi:pyridoxamine 5'-phosphate oxidase [Carboxylicivirga sp. M1479]|uniref:pyridoxamine 5'-phosphate oxidase n=1 Tax=Carboxylicivirga sp. M1479 TaxID=2594476 RepID=UPI0011788969|nr:pyridoxamine 5'-phosphate oxidase [Carboxylicivirga sp. M1479]TRX71027.1 pyridoxamine 5'-phosphate oxidase [Carboxylicivirga sp. M1479]
MNKLADIRNEYNKGFLLRGELHPCPFQQFDKWMKEAIKAECNEPTAFTLATVDSSQMPNCRIVLLKEVCDDGFVFFTNYDSCKGNELATSEKAAINFFWPELERQVRIRGTIEKVSEQKSDDYFQSRPRESQLGAWASDQSTKVNNSDDLHQQYTRLKNEYEDKIIPRPQHWGGFIVKPVSIEFWQGRSSRMHDRYQYSLNQSEWIIEQLAP